MAKFKGVDFYNLDSLLTEEERLTRESVREFVENRVIPIIEDYYERGQFPTELVKPLGDLGVLVGFDRRADAVVQVAEFRIGAVVADHDIQIAIGIEIDKMTGIRPVGSGPEIVRGRAHFVATQPAGSGAAREVCEMLMRAQDTLDAALARYLD